MGLHWIDHNLKFWCWICVVMYTATTTRRSIELEPKTLNQGQLSHARKVAADVVQKMEPKEVSSLFTQGLEHSVEEDEEEEEEGEKVIEKQVGSKEKKEKMEEKGCSMSVYSSAMVVDSPSPADQLHLLHHQHEPLSAPF